MPQALSEITRDQFEAHRDRRFGSGNPERMNNPLWEAIVREQADAYALRCQFGAERGLDKQRPVWCFDRMGMSRTLLPDNSILFIAGEHEDFYDPDFCIYNDVIVAHLDGRVDIYGYPRSDFPPTDFHSATLIDEAVYIIGTLGYQDERVPGTTPIYRLDLNDMGIRSLEIQGEEPSWLHEHQAGFLPTENAIAVWGGNEIDGRGEVRKNDQPWMLDLMSMRWRQSDWCAGTLPLP